MPDLIPDMARKRAEISADALAFRCQATARDWSFAEVNAAADAIGRALLDCGYAPGDRLAILTLNRVEFFLVLLACQKTGIILCPLNWRQPVPELADTLGPINATGLIYDPANADVALALVEALSLKSHSIAEDISSWVKQGAAPFIEFIDAETPWYLLFTSGTTGRPKAVIQTARMCWANAINIGQAINLTSNDRAVNFLPLFHTAGINLYTLPVFLFGGVSTILPKFEAKDLLALLRSGEVNQFFGVPAIYQAFSISDGVDKVNWPAIQCGCGGAPLAEPLIRFFAQRGTSVLNGFGMTETGPTTFLMDPGNAAKKIGSVGLAQMMTECRLAGVPDGAPGQGEILLKGPNITPGYYDNPTATQATFTESGWLKTGDVGLRDSDGYVFIVDRIKDMFISGGENVYPAEIENALHHHPEVLEAAVIGVPDEKWGEVGAAFLLPRPGADLDITSLRPWCRDRLAAYKIPAHFRIVDDFPRTAAGKIRKPELREHFPWK